MKERTNPKSIHSKIAIFDKNGNLKSDWIDAGDIKYEGIEIF